jgi:hypothetical protein
MKILSFIAYSGNKRSTVYLLFSINSLTKYTARVVFRSSTANTEQFRLCIIDRSYLKNVTI